MKRWDGTIEDPEITATELYAGMWQQWHALLPHTICDENPVVLCELLRLAGTPLGITRKDLEDGLGLIQSKISKLTKKLLAEKWLEVLHDEDGDQRLEFLGTTGTADTALMAIEVALETVAECRRNSQPRRWFGEQEDRNI